MTQFLAENALVITLLFIMILKPLCVLILEMMDLLSALRRRLKS